MSISQQTNAADAEQLTGSAQHIEYADTHNAFHAGMHQEQQTGTEQLGYVGPWPLRRSSTSSWTVVSGETVTTRASGLSRTGNSTNPFAASFHPENPFSDIYRSEGSSTRMMERSIDVTDSRSPSLISELTLTLEQVDQQGAAIQRILKRGATAASNDEAEGRSNFWGRMTGRPIDAPTASERREPQHQTAQPSRIQSQQQVPSDIEREAAATTLSQLEAEDCRACKEQASAAFAGKCMLVVTAGILGTSPYLIYYWFSEEYNLATAMMKEKQKTFLFLSLLAIPVTAALSLVFLAWLGLNSLGPTRRRVSGGVEYFKLWASFAFLTSCSYFLIATLTYKYVK
ncbi:uncharacterized protein A1O5_07314 [Cladophialophora psammophila CBS 110553]|uniref:Transmembrane protein n=1 Tax=Cladophialophora psammophila CBS 110553 TaxID=1182543 RepID=W9WN02_9EURO|nr:uncharacterized protein A1O5_07314 [Cladophialophora psammophila CBS 110553]EXJ69278.1 hypothetical protein A1O5_07314 [Cladophialophora psammophila CBS 110553]